MSLTDCDKLKKELKEQETRGFITRGQSPFAAPVLYVDKKDGGRRLWVDYRKLNSVTTTERTTPPRVEELMDTLSSVRVFTTLDLRSGYWQLPVDQALPEKTAFVTCFGQYQWNVMPFGLKNAPSVFIRYLTDVLYDLINQCVALYVDVICSPNRDTTPGKCS
mmetsp:Transcript_23914/g.34397  ORF Transcript_23914/g.34397 Transcript_23914/m.34397 type:complete len:163 (-) Transcript_23914:3630-4118(-)